jgi:hypothetical protein
MDKFSLANKSMPNGAFGLAKTNEYSCMSEQDETRWLKQQNIYLDPIFGTDSDKII